MNEKKSGFNIVIIITICTLFGKVLGVVRDSLISYYYGTNTDTDAFFLAMSIPTILLGVFTASTDSAIIPQYKRVKHEHTQKEADKLFSSIINTLSVIAIVISVIVFIYPEVFVKVFATGFDENSVYLTSNYLKFFAPIGLLHLWYCFFSSYNAAFRKNTARSILSFSTNLIVVISVLFTQSRGLRYVAIAYLISNIVSAFLPIIEMKSNGYKHSFMVKGIGDEYKKFWVLFLPIMGGALLNDIQQYVDKNLCSDIIGGISYLNYGIKPISIFDSILVVGIGVVILPMLSDYEIEKNYDEFSTTVSKITRLMMEILFPFMTVLLVMGNEIVILLYGRGAFGSEAINNVSMVLKVYSPLIVLTPMITIFSKFFHVKERNMIPLLINTMAVMINIILSIFLKNIWKTTGVALATTVATIVAIIIYIGVVQKKIGWDKKEIGVKEIVYMLTPMVIVVILNELCFQSLNLLFSIIVKLAVIIILYLITYLLFLRKDLDFWLNNTLKILKKSK